MSGKVISTWFGIMWSYIILATSLWGVGFIFHGTKYYKYAYSLLLLVVAFFASVRGDFATDYNNYKWLYETTTSLGIEAFASEFSKEYGFTFLMLISDFFISDFKFFMAVFHGLMIFLLGVAFYRLTTYSWLLLFFFVVVGPFYASFNITRQVFAAAVFFCSISCFGYFRHYFLGIVLSSMVHISSIVLLPFFYVLRVAYLYNFFFVVIFLLLFFILGDYLLNVASLTFIHYDSTRMGLSLGNALLGICALLLSLWGYFMGAIKSNLILNGCLFMFLFSVLSLHYDMFARFAVFFSIFLCWALVALVERSGSSYKRSLLCFLFGLCGIGYSYLSLVNTGYDPYYTFWS